MYFIDKNKITHAPDSNRIDIVDLFRIESGACMGDFVFVYYIHQYKLFDARLNHNKRFN